MLRSTRAPRDLDVPREAEPTAHPRSMRPRTLRDAHRALSANRAGAPLPAPGETAEGSVTGRQRTLSASFRDVTRRVTLAGTGGAVDILDRVSFDILEGEIVCLVGPAGCGKSTLLKMLAGLDRPDRGTVVALGAEVRGPHPSRGMVFQQDALFPWLDVRRNLAFGLEVAGASCHEISQRVDRLVELVGLKGFEHAYPHQLSGGMRQRAGIARVLAPSPRILLMDEPFAALDAFLRMQLQEELVPLWHRERFTGVFATHDVDEAVYLADRIVVMTRLPGQVKAVVPVPLARPRRRTDHDFIRIRNRILSEYDRAPAYLDDFSI